MEKIVYKTLVNVEKNYWWFAARREIIAYFLSRLNLGVNSKILEIGCGTGGNISMLSQFGSVSVIEKPEVIRDFIDNNFAVKSYSGVFPNDVKELPRKYFDLVALFDVLEHFENDREALIAIKTLLKPRGVLFLTVPAFMFLWSDHDRIHHHYRRYRRVQLKEMLESLDFKITKISYFNGILFPFIAMIRIINKIFHLKNNGEIKMLPAPLNDFLSWIFASEKYGLSFLNFPIGVSILVIAHN